MVDVNGRPARRVMPDLAPGRASRNTATTHAYLLLGYEPDALICTALPRSGMARRSNGPVGASS